MDYLRNILDIALRSITSLLFLFFITRFMGRKQISQLSFFDYVIGISIGSIAADMATGLEMYYSHGFLSMAIYGGIATLISLATCKNLKMRRFVNGRAYILIEKGIILNKNLIKVRYDINELLAEARFAGYFNIGDIEYAIMEPSGRMSFIPKSSKCPVTREDMAITKQQETPIANVIIDGNIMYDNIKTINLDEIWLKNQLKQQGYKKISDVLLATVDSNNKLTVFKYSNTIISKYQLD